MVKLENKRFRIMNAVKVLLLFAVITFLCGGTKSESVSNNKITILTYHNLIDRGEPDLMSISQEKFSADMHWLSKNGYHTILPTELYILKVHNRAWPKKTVMIVFDDGYFSNFSLAFPILKETNMKAAVMLITAHIKDAAPAGDPRIASLSWDSVKEMSDSGLIEFGSHTNNLHNPAESGAFIPGRGKSNGIQRLKNETKRNYIDRLDADIKKSILLIHEHTGKEVTSFAYPFGARDDWAEKVLKNNGIKMTFLTGDQAANLSNGLFDLKRVSIHENTDISRLLP